VPFAERGGRLRGLLDLATGSYPAFLFGGSLGDQLPVFHLHEVAPETLEPRLRHLAENGYRTLGSDEVAAFLRSGRRPAPRAVALTFDDARASVWTVAGPLLRRYGLRAITFAIPGRVVDARAVRPTLDDGAPAPGREDESDVPFATWPELKALHESGTMDVQSHTLTHAAIFCSDRPVGFQVPASPADSLLDRPLLSDDGQASFLAPSALGAPLYVRRSRMSDARRFCVDPGVVSETVSYVAAHGGASFFDRPRWRHELRARLPRSQGRFETPEEQARAVERELVDSRQALEDRFGRNTVRHVALPWGVCGRAARRAVERAGYVTAYAERMFHPKRIRCGDDPFWLMRLNGKFIPCLPGRQRRTFFSTVQDARLPR
jgi:peptidoglycan/xylan/chitin deacetylase (PgdA/CDA1 family)